MQKIGGKIQITFIVLFLLIVFYTTWDNNRINVVEQIIEVEGLSESLEGFTILQVTDLHEKVFGKGQRKLIGEINSLDYDVIVFTGDMLLNESSQNYAPFYNLLDGIENKKHALFVPGNSDPRPYFIHSAPDYMKDDFIVGMEERGVKWLESVHTIRKGSAVIQVVDLESSMINQNRIDAYTINSAYQRQPSFVNMQMKKYEDMSVLDQEENSGLLIALNHYPVVDQRIDSLEKDPNYDLRKYDLILAGHYHGGQFRIPFLGAFFVPEPYYERSGLFPPQDRVKGLWEYKGYKQYVSTGLGSSQTLPFMKFRLFNTPEINVLTFKKKDS